MLVVYVPETSMQNSLSPVMSFQHKPNLTALFKVTKYADLQKVGCQIQKLRKLKTKIASHTHSKTFFSHPTLIATGTGQSSVCTETVTLTIFFTTP